MLYQSTGIIRYHTAPLKLIVEVDPQISSYYRAMIPKWIHTQPQMYRTHISVVRNEQPPNMGMWGRHDGEEVEFHYENIVRSGEVYIWLNVFSTRLELLRTELGLLVDSPYTIPPPGFSKCFHITLGNFKHAQSK
jgi:hypothetical protein